MRVECAACGRFVDVPHVPTPCPKCGVLIEDLNPRVLVYRQGGFRLEKNPSGVSVESGAEPPAGSGPVTPNPYPIHRDPAPPVKRTVQIAIAVVVCLIIAYVVVDYVRMKSVSLLTQTTQPSSRATPENTGTAPPIQSVPPPTPAIPQAESPPPQTSPAIQNPVASAPQPPEVPAPSPTGPSTTTTPTVAPLKAARLHPVPAPAEPDILTDEALHRSIQQGVDYLLSQFNEQGQLDPEKHPPPLIGGRHALAALALIHVGQSTADERLSLSGPFMTRLIEQLKSYNFEGLHYETYSRSIRLMALAVPNRQDDRSIMQKDLAYLLKAQFEGAYSYNLPPNHEPNTPIGAFDNSNSQYGALGAWAAADAGFHLPAKYWRDVQTHWTKTQGAKGGWPYSMGGAESLTMTSAGVTMLFVAHDQLITDRSLMLDQAPYSAALEKGLSWLAEGNNAVTIPGENPGYALYGLERAGLASGYKRFGRHDWFLNNARQILAEQDKKTGAWPPANSGEVVETAFRLLFLARGRHPIVMNKLRFEGAWANRPRDVVRLAEFVYDSIERPVNWQVAALENDWSDWMDSPILYLSSHDRTEFSDEEVTKLRKFAEAGGLLFTHADADSHTFNQFAEELAKQMFPGYPMEDLPESHLIYSTLYPIRIKLPLRGVSNGARLLLVHSPTDLAAKWQFRTAEKAQPQFELGANLVVYATGKHPLRNRLDTSYIPEPKNSAIARVNVARLQHDGRWNPEPGAWDRFGRWFRKATSIELAVKTAEPTTLKVDIAPFTHLTTVAPVQFTDEQLQGIRRYVESGGVLFADVAGGSPDSVTGLRTQLIAAVGGNASFNSLPEDHPLLNAGSEGMINLGKPRLRVYSVGELGVSSGPTPEILEFGKGAIILSPLDVTSGLLGTTTWGILGYDPQYAQQLMNNAIIWTVTRDGMENTWEPLTTQPTR